MPIPPLFAKPTFSLPLPEGELKGVSAQRDAGGSYVRPEQPRHSRAGGNPERPGTGVSPLPRWERARVRVNEWP